MRLELFRSAVAVVLQELRAYRAHTFFYMRSFPGRPIATSPYPRAQPRSLLKWCSGMRFRTRVRCLSGRGGAAGTRSGGSTGQVKTFPPPFSQTPDIGPFFAFSYHPHAHAK